MPTHSFGDLHIDVREEWGTLRVDWRGKSNLSQPENVLTPFLIELVSRAAKAKAPLAMHFEALEFFNSSTITSIIRQFRKLPKELTVDVFYDPNHAWQRIFFDALWFFERSHPLFKVRAATPSGTRGTP